MTLNCVERRNTSPSVVRKGFWPLNYHTVLQNVTPALKLSYPFLFNSTTTRYYRAPFRITKHTSPKTNI